MTLCIRPSAQWQFFPGFIRGLQQPSLAGQLDLNLAAAPDAALLQEVLQRCIGRIEPRVEPSADEGADFVRRLVHWVCEWQRECRIPVSSAVDVLPRSEVPAGFTHSFTVAMPATVIDASSLALRGVVGIVNALGDAAGAAPDRLERLVEAAAGASTRLRSLAPHGFNRTHLFDAAFRLELPLVGIDASLLQIGTGRHLRLMDSTVTEETPHIAMQLSADKVRTADLLRQLGLPGAEHRLVADAEAAVAQAEAYGYPVVVKPADQDQGRGVAANLRSPEAVRLAFAEARKFSRRVLVERHFHGFGHRLTLYRGELVGVLKRIPGGVVGDGSCTVAQLLARRQEEGAGRGNLNLGRVSLDAEARAMLAESGLSPDSVPASGEFVMLRRRDNISAGGTAQPLEPSVVHPDNLRLVQRVARAMCLDVAGVDLLIPDISVSWLVSGALVCEVNGKPQFGSGHDGLNYDRVLRQLVGPVARVPVAVYWCADTGAPELPQRLAAAAARHGLQTVACGAGLWRGGERCTLPFPSDFEAARAALRDREVESLLFAIGPEEVLQRGLPVDRVDSMLADPATSWDPPGRARLDAALELLGQPPSAVRFE